MTRERDPEEFEKKWKNQIDQLYKLHHTLPESELGRLARLIEDFNELVELAADELEDEPTGTN